MASATGTNGRGAKWAAAWALVVVCGGCRGCAEDPQDRAPDASAAQPAQPAQPPQPAMPTGMLMPTTTPDAATTEAGASVTEDAGAAAGRVVRGRTSGAWVELQYARPGDAVDRRDFTRFRDDSWFVSLETMTMLHEPFARALPGFDLFLPRLFAPDALARLADELAAHARTSGGESAMAASELARIVTLAASKKQSLWVLGPP